MSEQNHQFTREVTTKDAAGNVLGKTTQNFAIGNTPPQRAEDWENYVKLIVSIFGAAPYNFQYYQVWNEAYPGSGFWWGGMDQYMDLIHLPAAKIIQKAGKKVVYGGWICGAPINEFIDLLDRKKAWKSVYVFDMHYMPLEAMDRMYDAAKKGWESSAITATFKGIGKDWTVKRVDLFGNETQLNWEKGKNGKGTTQVTVPVPDTNADAKAVNATGNETIFYIVAQAPTTGGH